MLTGLSGSYEELDPDLELIVEYVPPDDLESRVADEVKSGFGPDVLIGADAAELFDLVAAGAVHRITRSQAERYGYDEVDTRALAAMAVDETQRGVPLAASTDVLYYCDGVEPRRTTCRNAATREVSRTRRPRRRSCGIPNSRGSSSSPPGNVATTKC